VFRLLLVALLVILLFGWTMPPLSVPARGRLKRWGLRAGVAVVIVMLLRVGLLWPAGLGLALILGLRFAAPMIARVLPNIASGRPGAQANPFSPPASGVPNPRVMSRPQALEVLNLKEGASREEILNSYRELIKKVHPDRGGSTYLASEVNRAKDVLLQ
jgi:hypothetical protein